MSAEGVNNTVSISAGADLSALQHHIINISGTVCIEGNSALGVLQNKPLSGEDASIAYRGHMKAKAGGTIAKADRVSVTASGTLVAVTSGSNFAVLGKALVAASSGGLCEFVGDFSTCYVSTITS